MQSASHRQQERLSPVVGVGLVGRRGLVMLLFIGANVLIFALQYALVLPSGVQKPSKTVPNLGWKAIQMIMYLDWTPGPNMVQMFQICAEGADRIRYGLFLEYLGWLFDKSCGFPQLAWIGLTCSDGTMDRLVFALAECR